MKVALVVLACMVATTVARSAIRKLDENHSVPAHKLERRRLVSLRSLCSQRLAKREKLASDHLCSRSNNRRDSSPAALDYGEPTGNIDTTDTTGWIRLFTDPELGSCFIPPSYPVQVDSAVSFTISFDTEQQAAYQRVIDSETLEQLYRENYPTPTSTEWVQLWPGCSLNSEVANNIGSSIMLMADPLALLIVSSGTSVPSGDSNAAGQNEAPPADGEAAAADGEAAAADNEAPAADNEAPATNNEAPAADNEAAESAQPVEESNESEENSGNGAATQETNDETGGSTEESEEEDSNELFLEMLFGSDSEESTESASSDNANEEESAENIAQQADSNEENAAGADEDSHEAGDNGDDTSADEATAQNDSASDKSEEGNASQEESEEEATNEETQEVSDSSKEPTNESNETTESEGNANSEEENAEELPLPPSKHNDNSEEESEEESDEQLPAVQQNAEQSDEESDEQLPAAQQNAEQSDEDSDEQLPSAQQNAVESEEESDEQLPLAQQNAEQSEEESDEQLPAAQQNTVESEEESDEQLPPSAQQNNNAHKGAVEKGPKQPPSSLQHSLEESEENSQKGPPPPPTPKQKPIDNAAKEGDKRPHGNLVGHLPPTNTQPGAFRFAAQAGDHRLTSNVQSGSFGRQGNHNYKDIIDANTPNTGAILGPGDNHGDISEGPEIDNESAIRYLRMLLQRARRDQKSSSTRTEEVAKAPIIEQSADEVTDDTSSPPMRKISKPRPAAKRILVEASASSVKREPSSKTLPLKNSVSQATTDSQTVQEEPSAPVAVPVTGLKQTSTVTDLSSQAESTDTGSDFQPSVQVSDKSKLNLRKEATKGKANSNVDKRKAAITKLENVIRKALDRKRRIS